MSAAFRTASLPAGGLSALAVRRCRRGKLKSTSDRKAKNRVNSFMETPFKMRESYNIQFHSGKRKIRVPCSRAPANRQMQNSLFFHFHARSVELDGRGAQRFGNVLVGGEALQIDGVQHRQ